MSRYLSPGREGLLQATTCYVDQPPPPTTWRSKAAEGTWDPGGLLGGGELTAMLSSGPGSPSRDTRRRALT